MLIRFPWKEQATTLSWAQLWTGKSSETDQVYFFLEVPFKMFVIRYLSLELLRVYNKWIYTKGDKIAHKHL